MTQQPHVYPTPGLRTAIWRGLRFRCPVCGKGAIFRAYLKQVDTCAVCGEPIGEIPAEDGPAWLTVLSLGPVLVALTLFISMSGWPMWVTLPLSAAMVIGAVLAWLPRIKALVIAVLLVSNRD
ncbi:DUF983 domain-containing protein [Hyphomonas pacifica]|uniref:Uncharacterized protein n=1 Tax=Hyphomonas pacifica TaxID=1280941 RepID=A0A062TXF1_9PROT|nr:DUF983 domain-containing protein [Hyphomonas pacifica]KCZ49451.1 hypothetical protein HY2_03430 [Hyphomonas pacifica]MBR9806136.1 DUF983 domain-containing protein [Alphaproteobacteria bacterium]RAN32986.1 hypothetical protein HY11_04655 [Hyphomonas pacifica]RAN33257.1 hypothetical protein HY3_02590 [Hyphomonas pacifica]